MKIYGKTYTRAELERHTGNLAQLGGTRHYELSEGTARGVRAIDCDLGSGLRFTVLPDRGMDISLASFNGHNLVFRNCVDEVHPAYYDAHGAGWLRSFFAGLLTTCGLTHFGPPVVDGGEELGVHGRHSNIPAARFADLSGWEGDEYLVRLRGVVEDGAIFHDKLRLTRTISASLGGRSLRIEDEVQNFGFAPSPFCILYHFNLGFPLLAPGTELHVSANGCEPRDERGAAGFGKHMQFEEPVQSYPEQVFTHRVVGRDDGQALAALVNRNLDGGLALYLRFDPTTLPYMTQWKNMANGEYVLGMEPCNAPVLDRITLRERGLLQHLEAGETRRMTLEVGLASGPAEIEALLARING